MKKTFIAVAAALLLAANVWAKLPPPSEEAKAKAAETAAKAAHAGKVDAFKLCKSMDQVAATYFDQAKAAGKTVPAAAQMAACADPGVFVYVAPVAAASAGGAVAAPGAAAPVAGATAATAATVPAAKVQAATSAAPVTPVAAAAPAPVKK